MAQVLLAGWRIELGYTVRAFPHKQRFYCDVDPSADVSGYDVVDRLGAGGLGVSTAVETYLGAINQMFSGAETTFDYYRLDQYVSGSWQPIYVGAPIETPDAMAGPGIGVQLTVSMRDTAFFAVKTVLLEGTFAAPEKSNSPTGLNASYDPLGLWFTTPGAGGENGWSWVKSRGNRFLGSFVSLVTDTNDKVRRGRYLA